VSLPRWLHPGINLKRWLVVLAIGITILSLSAGYVLRDIYDTRHFPTWVATVTLQGWPRWLRAVLFCLVGLGCIVLALRRLGAVMAAGLAPNATESVVQLLYQQRKLSRGHKIVCVGGGTGLSLLLHALKEHTGNLTAIVTVADDGGSSGRLRQQLRILPPGDFRQCIAALADVEPLMTDLFNYRFKEGSGLEGHAFGNLFIAAMAGVTGNFESALRESSKILAVRGQILPSTLEDVKLHALLADQSTIAGESNFHGEGDAPRSSVPIERVFLVPPNAQANPEAVTAILEADMIVVGPGSLYTSVLPNLLVKDIALAMSKSRALKVFVCNVATENGETNGYTPVDFVRAVERHVTKNLFHYVITNNRLNARRPSHMKSDVVPLADGAAQTLGPRVIATDVVDTHNALRHDSTKLAAVLIRLLEQGRQTVRQHEQLLAEQQAGTAGSGRPQHEITSVINVSARQRRSNKATHPDGEEPNGLVTGAPAERH